MNFQWLYSDTTSTVLAGASGGLVRWLTLRHNLREGIVALIVGGLCALYLGPVISPILEPIIGKIAPQGDASGFSSVHPRVGGEQRSGRMRAW